MAIQTFSYLFVIPFQLGLAAGLDVTGKLTAWAAGTFFLGLAIGPFVGGSLLVHFGYVGIAASVAVSVFLALVIFLSIVCRLKSQAVSVQGTFSCADELAVQSKLTN